MTVTTVALPFSYTLYDQTFNAVNLSSNGNAQFTTLDTAFTNVCPAVDSTHTTTLIFPYWDDQQNRCGRWHWHFHLDYG